MNAFDVYDHNFRDRRQVFANADFQELPPSIERNVFMASSKNQLGRLSAILKSSQSIDLLTYINGHTALHSAAKKGYTEICRALVSFYEEEEMRKNLLLRRTEDGDGKTALMIAAYNGHYDVVALLASGAHILESNIFETDSRGNTAIHYAAWGGHLLCVQYLVNLAGNGIAFVANNEGLSPMQLAAAGNFHIVVEYLSSLSSARVLSEVGMVASNSIQKSGISGSGMTALHRAASHGSYDTVVYLLKDCVDEINIPASNGNTALHYACQHGHFEIVCLLLNHPSIVISLHNEYGLTAFHYACIGGYSKIVVQMLPLLSHSETTSVNSNGETALHLAAAAGEHEVCRILLDHPHSLYDIFACDKNGSSVIDKAVESGYKELANKLALHACFCHKTMEIEKLLSV